MSGTGDHHRSHQRSSRRCWRRARPAVAVAISLTVAAGLLGVPAASADVAQARLAARAPELVATADEAALRLADAEGDLRQARDRLARARTEVGAATEGVTAAVEAVAAAEDAAAGKARHLRALGIAAYMGGGLTPEDVAVEALTSDGFDTSVESRLVLIDTVTSTLLADRHAALLSVAEAEAGVDEAEAEVAEREAATAEAEADVAEAEAEVAARRAEADDARRAAEGAVALALLRDLTPRPEPHRSGLVPPPVVPPEVMARVGAEIPRTSLEAYWRAAATMAVEIPGCEIDWALVAGIGLVETRHATYGGARPEPDGAVAPAIVGIALDGSNGTAVIDDTDDGRLDGDPFLDRAVGPMQFLPRTWGAHGGDGNGDGVVDPHNVFDAAQASARYLCRSASGSVAEDPAALRRAVFSYNRAGWYVAKVVAAAERYRLLVDPEADTPPEVELPPPGAAGGDPDDPTRPAEPPDPDDPTPSSTTTSTSTTSSTTSTSSTTTSTTSTTAPRTPTGG